MKIHVISDDDTNEDNNREIRFIGKPFDFQELKQSNRTVYHYLTGRTSNRRRKQRRLAKHRTGMKNRQKPAS